ncbi:sulfite oxidase heme-binding subunit YedZ [Hydrogenophaga sp.]|uniref:sulfite oxidase heme-binding subunit YedZ n=1 Tax=Hydrogenophaga sp. TaxID=1904254 RepID=UPI00271C03CD|nr:protein-methionine-sulfoxide reductase heme-binding subunit MsrQ [Hydrogenophaga sp.]MDO9505664.1 protein-methionine-sulfoxide reductase heme-binding subunit MsrQ [Hydrogenophaga sp.]MDP2988125.1 protein-methionine-sulfoxide reductase heme-binding subunit MsrQ [Hydrogenophaga sp.]MDP3627295.1 protein-methionine-sulfoxide reductase heme-binding subunit MsrQ [Hydrogenophaga sp.]
MPSVHAPGLAAGSRPAGSRINRWLGHSATKPVGFALALLPFAWLVWAAFTNQLGANPAEALIRSLGDWTIRFLVLVLAITPLRTVTGWVALARLRRMVGLFVFFYACLHLLAYAWFDMEFSVPAVVDDVIKRPFILVGFLGWLLLLVLAATSFNRAIRAMGAQRWQLLHRAVYAIAGLAVLHFFWMRSGKNDFTEVAVYAGLFSALLGWRLWRWLSKLRAA